MSNEVMLLGIFIIIGGGSAIAFAQFVKRAIISYYVSKAAKACVGDEVSIYTDKGARLAYKGVCAFLSGDFSRALTIFEKSLEFSYVSHNCSFCYDWIARCYEAQDKPVEALAYSVKAVQAEPSNVKSLFNLAELYAREGLFEKSEFYYNFILKYEPQNPHAYFMLGTLRMSVGEYEKAQECFLKTLECDENFVSVYPELSVLMAIKGDYEQAQSYHAKADEKLRGVDFSILDSERLQKRLNSIRRIQELCHDY